MQTDTLLLVLALVIFCSFAVSGIAHYLFSWALRTRISSLEYAISDVDARVNREVKVRAGEAGRRKRDVINDLEAQLVGRGADAPGDPPAGEGIPDLHSWRDQNFRRNA